MSETSAGSIIGTLRLSITDFETNIAKAQELADRLDGKNVNVDVNVNSAGAETKLAAVAASEDKVDAGNKKIASSSQEAGKGMGLLSMAIVGLGPAIVPLAAGATGLAVGFGAMGTAGVLAIVGIMREMKAGTPLGGAYTSMLATLSGDLGVLGHTAAAGVLGPFQKEVATLQGQMPALNSIIGEFSVITGKTAGNLMSGLVAAFIALEPLARDVGVYVLDLSSKFAAAMSGPGVVSFGDYIRSVFPQVMQSVESIVTAAVHLVAALAPLGLGTLGMLRVFADAINAIPVDVLSNLATVAVPIFVGFKAFGILSVGVTAFGAALEFVGVSAETAATGLAIMNVAAGAIAAVIAIAMFAFTANAESTRQNTQAINDYTDALIRSNGAIDVNVREMAFKKLTDSGAIEDAKALGLNLSTVTDAMLGNVPASRSLNAQMVAMSTGSHESGAAFLTQQTHINDLSTALGNSTSQFGTATQNQKDHAAAMAVSSTAAGTLTTATLLGMNAQQQSESTNKSQIATIKTLNAAMDEEISRALNLAGATSNLDQATLTMTETLKKNKLTMDQHTQAGIDDRRAIEGVAASLEAQRQANIKAGDSTAVATGKYQAASAALLDQTGKMYGTTSQAYKYMKQLLDIPPTVKTDLGITGDTAARKKIADVQVDLSKLPAHKDVTVTVGANFKMGTGGANSMGFFTNAPGGADGGPVTGGIPGRDSVLRTLMPKEYIVRADGSNLGDAAAYYGVPAPGMAAGGPVSLLPPPIPTRMNQASQSFLSTVGFNPAALGGGAGGSAGGAAQWASTVLAVLAVMGQPASLLAGVLRLINKESSGNANSINNWDINAKNGTPSMGLIQTIMPTFLANAGPYAALGPYNPFANIYAGLQHAIGSWGSIAAVDPLVHAGGYDTGGMMMPGGMGQNRGRLPERVLSGSQTAMFEAGMAAAGGGGGGDIVTHTTVNLDGKVLFATVRRESIDAARANGTSGLKL